MTKATGKKNAGELRPEYRKSDFRVLQRGNYAERLRENSNVVVIDPDLTDLFPNADAVNKALRSLAEIARRAGKGALTASSRASGRRP